MVSTTPPINRVDRRLWRRFIEVALPYWYPSKGKAGLFLFMLAMLLVFLFAILFVAVAGTVWLGQLIAPEFTQLVASGLVAMKDRAIASPTYLIALACALIIPMATFAWQFSQLRSRFSQWGLLAVLLLLSISVSGLNVVLSYVVRFIETSLVEREVSTFWLFLGVFAAVFIIGTPIVVIFQYCTKLLGVYWREWLTNNFLQRYLQNRAYYRINDLKQIDNPDQRIAEDIKSFTGSSLSFLLVILNSLIDLVAFIGVLWTISQVLTLVLIAYSLFGTLVTILLGKRLIGLNYNQLQREADFRYGLVHLRNNAESIAFYGGEEQELVSVGQRFSRVLRNFHVLIGWQRNLDFFTTGHSYFVRMLPYLVVGPIF